MFRMRWNGKEIITKIADIWKNTVIAIIIGKSGETHDLNEECIEYLKEKWNWKEIEEIFEELDDKLKKWQGNWKNLGRTYC